jgi:hypothetical protein
MKRFANWLMGSFANRYDYDASYMGEYAEASPGGFLRYLVAMPFAQYRKKAPLHVYFAAKLVATRRADCGPCLRLVYNMAREADVDEVVIRAALMDDVSGLNDRIQAEDVDLAVRYANAVLDQDLITVGDVGEAILNRWDRATLNEIAGAIAFGQFFPTLKRGLLHAQTCEPVLRELGCLADAKQQPVCYANSPNPG